MEGDDAGRIDHPTKSSQYNNKATSMTANEWHSLDEIARSTIRMHLVENVYFGIGQRDDDIYLVGEAPGYLWEVVLIKDYIDPTVVQYEDERDRFGDLPYQHL